jgi:RNA polymerase sigma factor (sigma-70 family)
MTKLTDFDLLDAYARQRSEEAFRELVSRHVDFVYSAALRQLQNPHLAQEATQTAFITLAAKASQLRRQTIIAGWLHHAARFAALKLRRSEARHKQWEQKAAAMNVSSEPEAEFPEEALSHVDAALDDLNEPDRNAIILRFSRQMSLRDVAEAIGTSEEAAKKRVSRALDRLRQLLTRRGITVSVTAIAAGLSELPLTAAPVALPSAVSALAVQTPAVSGGAGLAMLLGSAKVKFAIVATVVVACGLVVLLWPHGATNAVIAPAQTNITKTAAMRIKFTSVMVNDQDEALRFYTNVLGFIKKRDIATGPSRFLTVVSPLDPDGIELLLEPMNFAPARVYQAAVYRAGIPFTAFITDDLQREYDRLSKSGAKFRRPPRKSGLEIYADFNDTCGNYIQLMQSAPGSRTNTTPGIRLSLTSVIVDDLDKAKTFYTDILGFLPKMDIPAGGSRWITVVSPDEPEGTELLLEPMGFAPARVYQRALFGAGIPLTSFQVANVQTEYERLVKLGVIFTKEPSQTGSTTTAVFDDTCGNLIQIFQP